MKLNWIALGSSMAVLAVVVASFFVGSYFYAKQQNLAIERAQLEMSGDLIRAEKEREALFAPHISTSGIVCDLRPGDEALSARSVAVNIQASDPDTLAQKLLDVSKKYPGVSLKLTIQEMEGISASQTYKSIWVDGFVPPAHADEFVAYIRALEDKKSVFITEVRSQSFPASTISADCIQDKNFLQELALKEAVYIERLRNSESLDENALHSITQNLVYTRADAASILNNTFLISRLRVYEQLDSVIFRISINDLKG